MPTMQVKKVTKAQTDMTEYAAEAIDAARIEKTPHLAEVTVGVLRFCVCLSLGRISMPQITPDIKTVQ